MHVPQVVGIMEKPQPNFPPSLNINPSVLHQAHASNSLYDEERQKASIAQYGIAGRVWEAAWALDTYLHHQNDDHIFDPPSFLFEGKEEEAKTILELGSGSGLVASSLWPTLKPGRDLLIVTDLPEVCEMLEDNLKEGISEGVVAVAPLTWGLSKDVTEVFDTKIRDRKGSLTHVLCSDLVHLTSTAYYSRSNLTFLGIFSGASGTSITNTASHYQHLEAFHHHGVQNQISRKGTAVLVCLRSLLLLPASSHIRARGIWKLDSTFPVFSRRHVHLHRQSTHWNV